MKPTPADENPYASPQTVAVERSPEDLLRATARIYRGMGGVGLALWLLSTSTAVIANLANETPANPIHPGGLIAGTVLNGLLLALFVFTWKTGRWLEEDFDRAYPRARFLAIVSATVLLPWLTWPGIVAVRRLERYRRLVGSSTQAEP